MFKPLIIPNAQPARKVPGYEMPDDDKNLLSWDFVEERMAPAEYYWISSVNQRCGPHVVPLWGIWYNSRIHFDGSPKTGWAQNLVRNSQIAVNLPNAEKVVVLYGHARTIEDDELNEQEWDQLDSTFQTKYNVQEGSPYWFVEPSKVLAWNGGNLHTMTRWIFE